MEKVTRTLLDDMMSPDQEVEADAGTVPFGLDGKCYEIDLCSKNATKLRSVLRPFIENARVVRKNHNGKTVRSDAPRVQLPVAGSDYSPEQKRVIRDWGRKNGWPTLSNKGRIPFDLFQAFEERAGR